MSLEVEFGFARCCEEPTPHTRQLEQSQRQTLHLQLFPWCTLSLGIQLLRVACCIALWWEARVVRRLKFYTRSCSRDVVSLGIQVRAACSRAAEVEQYSTQFPQDIITNRLSCLLGMHNIRFAFMVFYQAKTLYLSIVSSCCENYLEQTNGRIFWSGSAIRFSWLHGLPFNCVDKRFNSSYKEADHVLGVIGGYK